MIKSFRLAVVISVLLVALVVVVPASAKPTRITVFGTCEGAQVTVTYEGADGAYQDSIIEAMTEDGTPLDSTGIVPFGREDMLTVTLSWGKLPEGTVVFIWADHMIYSGPNLGLTVDLVSYTCSEPVIMPETDKIAQITADMAVYSQPDLNFPIAGAQVKAGQEFLLLDTKVVGDMTWYQIWVGGEDYPWVPAVGAVAASR